MAKGVLLSGIGVLGAGAVLLVVSVVGSQGVLSDYASREPDDTTGPCEGVAQDVSACNALGTMQSLWLPGWGLVFVGIAIASADRWLAIKRRGAAPTSTGAPATTAKFCASCGAAVTGPFCAACGAKNV